MRQKPIDFGIGLRARHPSVLGELAREAQAAGFTHLWVYDSPRFAEAYVSMMYCALVAPSLVIGTAVTNTETRDPSVIANAFATLSLLTDGRVVLGVGLGDSAVKFIGKKPARFEAFREKLRLIQALLEGETIEYNGQRLKLPAPPAKQPPLLIAAERLRTFELAGARCAGAIISPGGSPRFLRHAVREIREAASRAGRNPAALYLCGQVHCAVAETTDQALDEIVPPLNRTLFRYAMRVPHQVLGLAEPILPGALRGRAREIVSRQEAEYEGAAALRAAMGEDLLRELVVAGTPVECKRKLGALLEIEGVSQLIINIHGKDLRASLGLFRDELIPAFR
jgi:alkanesulfonate monooxygenase SsuD/methylene tetrahydromethanopterin reductase-like flavin-dependent oxidoreductase (luciferase family)